MPSMQNKAHNAEVQRMLANHMPRVHRGVPEMLGGRLWGVPIGPSVPHDIKLNDDDDDGVE